MATIERRQFGGQEGRLGRAGLLLAAVLAASGLLVGSGGVGAAAGPAPLSADSGMRALAEAPPPTTVPAPLAQPQRTEAPSFDYSCGKQAGLTAVTGAQALARGISWVLEKVPYSQEACHTNGYGTYRTDCSGFVSMAWGLSSSYNTWSLWGVTTGISLGAMQPGDIFLRDSGGVTHTALFVKWMDPTHAQAEIYQESGAYDGQPALDTVITVGDSYWSQFSPRRYTHLTVSSAAAETPLGHLDGLTYLGDKMWRARGWAFETDVPALSVQIAVQAGGLTSVYPADAVRTDVGRVYPSAGSRHGFDIVFTAPPGYVTVMVSAVSAGHGSNTRLGSAAQVDHAPFGHLDALATIDGGMTWRARGWAIDPDSRPAPVTIEAAVNGVVVGRSVADGLRPDVGRVYPGAGDNHGYDFTFTVPPGQIAISIVAVSTWGYERAPQGSAAQNEQAPWGYLDTLTGSGGTWRIRGWTVDTDAPTTPVPVLLIVDGQATTHVADVARDDVARAFPAYGPRHGYDITFTLSPGEHAISVVAEDLNGPFDTALGVRQVTVAAPTA